MSSGDGLIVFIGLVVHLDACANSIKLVSRLSLVTVLLIMGLWGVDIVNSNIVIANIVIVPNVDNVDINSHCWYCVIN